MRGGGLDVSKIHTHACKDMLLNVGFQRCSALSEGVFEEC